MIKGVRIQATNSVSIGAYSAGLMTAVGLLTLPTGKSFILTDLVCAFTPSHTVALEASIDPGVALLDIAEGQQATAFTAGEIKVMFRAPRDGFFVNTLSSNNIVRKYKPLVVTDMQNGPEFSTCVSAGGIGTLPIPTFGLWVGGIMR